jgi:hypothetical protein
MTAFITHYWKKHLEPLALLALMVGALLSASAALAGSIEPKSAVLVPDERGHALTVEFAIDLGPRLEEAVSRGVPLNFRLEFTLSRKRWYWIDEHVAGHVIDYRLSYQALTRQYRLSLGGLHRNFDALDDALQVLERTARLHVVGRGALLPGENYTAAVRLSLDHSQLPKPLQIDALADRDWRVEARTLRWGFVPTAEK